MSASAKPPSFGDTSSKTCSEESLPSHITSEIDQATGKIYYLDHNTKTTTWLHPSKKPFTEGLPWPWERQYDSKGRAYYLNHENRTTSWLDPVKLEQFKTRGALEGNIYEDVEGGDCVVEEKTTQDRGDAKVYYVNYSKDAVGGPD